MGRVPARSFGQVVSGFHDVLIAGGVEHMTRVPMGSDGQSLTATYFEHYDEVTTQGGCAEPKARIVDTPVVGVDPLTMLTGPIPATREILQANDMAVDDIDRFEVNEAFASVIAARPDETGADWDRVNTRGGAATRRDTLYCRT